MNSDLIDRDLKKKYKRYYDRYHREAADAIVRSFENIPICEEVIELTKPK